MSHIQIYLCFKTLILQQEKPLLLHAERNSTEERKILPFQAELYLGRMWGAESWLHLRAWLHPVLGCTLKDSQNESWHSPGKCEWPLTLCYRKKKIAQVSFLPITLPYNDILTLFTLSLLDPLPITVQKAFYPGVAQVIQNHNRLSSPFVPWYNDIWPSKY